MIKHVTKVVLFVVILEMTIFNFRHWESKFFPEVNQPLIEVAEGIEKLDDTIEYLAHEKFLKLYNK